MQPSNVLTPDLRLRRCRKCENKNMACAERWVDSYNVQSKYVCANCGHKTTLAAGGGATGMMLGACLIIAFALSLALATDDGIFDIIDLLKAVSIFALILLFPIRELTKPKRYPVTGKRKLSQEEAVLDKSESVQIAARRAVARLDTHKPLYGMIVLFLFIAIVLGGAAIFGWVNHTYFDNNAFS